jgi:hypothetical protein
MYELRSPSPRVLWFVLGDSVLAIGAAFMLESFFLYASGMPGGGWIGNQTGYLGFLLMIIGAATAIGSIPTGRAARRAGVDAGR